MGRRRCRGKLVLVLRTDCGSYRLARRQRAGIGVVGSYTGRYLTLGDAIWKAASVLLAVRAVGVEAYLGRDQGGEGAALDEAHLDGWGSISINCTVSAGSFAQGTYLGWQDDGSRWGRGWVRSSSPHSCEFLAAGIFRLARRITLPGAPTSTSRTTSTTPTAHHRNHVRRLQVNWLPLPRARAATLCDTRFCPRIPHILDQRGCSPPAQDDLRRCARCSPQERLYSDQEGERRRGNEARAGLQRRCRLQDLVRCPGAQPIKG